VRREATGKRWRRTIKRRSFFKGAEKGSERVEKLSITHPILALFAWAASAQMSNGDSNSQAGNSSSSAASQQGQSSRSASSAQGTDSDQNVVEGCVIQRETDYYVQPESGEAIRLSGSDLGRYVGHRVRLHGSRAPNPERQDYYGATNTTSSATARAGSSQNSNAGTTSQEFLVTRIDTIAETCPTANQNNQK
jgi:hypothetical protein